MHLIANENKVMLLNDVKVKHIF